MTRVLALHAPLFPLAAILRAEPALRDQAVAACEGSGGASRIVAAGRHARGLGVRPGMSLAQARGLVPDLIARGRDPTAEVAAHQALTEAADRVSPRVESFHPDLLVADLSGTETIFGTEIDLAREAVLAAEDLGLFVRAGVGDSGLVARIAASMPDGPVVVPPGGGAEFLAPLPTAYLHPTRRAAERLDLWGIDTIGRLAELPEGELAARLGPEGTRLHREARAIDDRPLTPTPPQPILQEGQALEWAVVALEPFLAAVHASLSRLCRRLDHRGDGCACLELELSLEPDGAVRRTVRLPSPTTDADTLTGLIRLDLEAHSPGAPVAGFTLLAHPAERRRAQLTLFGPEQPSPERVGAVVARLSARIGPDRVGAPTTADAHMPGPGQVTAFEPPSPPKVARPPRPAPGLLAVRTLEPPPRLEVIVDGDTERPMSLRTLPGERPELRGLIRVASGPWFLESGWWDDPADRRSYWDVELSGGNLVRIFRRPDGEWLADGLYD